MRSVHQLIAVAILALPAQAATVTTGDYISFGPLQNGYPNQYCPMPQGLASTGSTTFQCAQGSWLTGVPPGGWVIEVDAYLQFSFGFFNLNPPNGQSVIQGPVSPNTPIVTMNYTLNLGG